MRLGYRVSAYTDPRSALEAFSRQPRNFDLVMTDLVMPDMNGETLAREVRRISPSCPVILATGYRPKQMIADTDMYYALMEKPIQPAELARRLRELLSGT
jgi:CheY-like chemotaxis protein